MFSRGNLGQGLAASTIMLTTVLIILVPWALLEFRPEKRRGGGLEMSSSLSRL